MDLSQIRYESFDRLREQHGDEIAHVGRAIRERYPLDWAQAHNGDPDSGSLFVRRWAGALRARGINVGVNGKRGGTEPSQDILTFPIANGGNTDTSGRYGRILIVDVIGGAGGPNPSLQFNDVSAPAPGRFLDPWGVDDVSVPSPPPVVVPPPPTPPTEPPVPSPPPVDAQAIAAAILAALEPRLAAIESKQQHVIHAMFGPLESPTLLEHIDDLKNIALSGGTQRGEKFR